MERSEHSPLERALVDARSEALELGAYFCANPECLLHLRVSDAGVVGEGNWIVLADGRRFGRSRRGTEVLCDACVTGRGPVKMPLDRELRDMLLADRSNCEE